MLQTTLQILRVFGLPAAEVTAILRTVRDEGCPGLRLLERDGEFAVCIQGSAPTQEMAKDYCETWAQRLRACFGDALYAEGEISLAQAALTALLQKRKLLVAVDEPTGRLLGDALRGLEHSEAAFDFGNQSYLDPEAARRITVPPTLLQKFPGDLVQAAAGRCVTALLAAQADLAVAYMPANVGQAPFVLVCDKRGAVATALSPEANDRTIANHLLELVRRRVLGLPPAPGAIAFRPGHERPLLVVSPAGQVHRGDTTRFSVRKARPKNLPVREQDYEPMLDMDTATRTFGAALELGGAAPHAATMRLKRRPAPAPAPQPAPAAEEAPPHSLLDEDIPDLTAPAEAAPAAPAPMPDVQMAADRLYGRADPLPPERAEALRNRSLRMIEKSERRSRRTVILILLLLLLILLAGGFALWRYFRGDLGRQPAPRMYGTARFDEQAAAYLDNARAKQAGVLGYLAFPGQEGQLVYTAAAAADPAADPEAPRAALAASYLGAEQPGHTVIRAARGLEALTGLAALQENSGFTLYTPGAAYRCKVLGVYYADPADTGAAAFDPAAYGDLSAYRDYLSFVLGVRVRSLFDTGVNVGQGAGFITLTMPDAASGAELCVTGRLLRETESAQLSAAAVQTAPQPLLTAAQYAARGEAVPDVRALLADQLAWYAADRSTLEEMSAADTDALLGELHAQVDDLHQQAEQAITAADELMMQGLTDVSADGVSTTESDLNQGAAGTLPEQQVDIPLTPAATEAPAEPTAEPTADPETGEIPQAPETQPPVQAPSGGTSAVGETINVTMNGVAQSMDLVRCLAMVAENEMGSSAPAEAYKAQCVATHCWILSQSGYPAVLGKEPGAAALAAAEEVAHVMVSYGGKVAFTPYFASASKGTASSADVWGGERAWLQPVDSPYDEQFATNWHTSGASSGTARFSRQKLLERIKSRLNIDLSNVDPNQWFKILSANQYGWVAQMQIGPDGGPNTTCRGSWFRETLLAGQSVSGSSLRSQCFTFTYNPSNDCFEFDVYGYGHGVGMSQWGAIGYARNGWNYAQILTHYYPGTTLATY